jgi:hypothetical protein
MKLQRNTKYRAVKLVNDLYLLQEKGLLIWHDCLDLMAYPTYLSLEDCLQNKISIIN